MNEHSDARARDGHDVGAAVRRRATIIFSGLAALLGAASVAVTLANGGGPLQGRLWIGVMLMALGVMRLWLTLKSPVGKVGAGAAKGGRR